MTVNSGGFCRCFALMEGHLIGLIIPGMFFATSQTPAGPDCGPSTVRRESRASSGSCVVVEIDVRM
jgi:hypothetical protein